MGFFGGVYTPARNAFGIAVAGGEQNECVQDDSKTRPWNDDIRDL